MKIIRYSKQGFKSQYQSEHLKHVYYELNDFNINDFPEHLRWSIKQIHEKNISFYKEHLKDLKDGIWVFIDGYKDNQSLNHLKEKVPCWEADIDDSTECYDVNWQHLLNITDEECKIFGVYIPKRELHKIRNIKKRHRN